MHVIPLDVEQMGNRPFPTAETGLRAVPVDSERVPVVVSPKQLLDYKCYSWRYLSRQDRKRQAEDAADVGFLLGYMKERGMKATAREVRLATPTFVGLFSRFNWELKPVWRELGFELHPEEGPRQRA